jgi:hypothetical protein
VFQGFPGNDEPYKGKTPPAKPLKMGIRFFQREGASHKGDLRGIGKGLRFLGVLRRMNRVFAVPAEIATPK